jgi:hypothetical protein
MGQYFGANRASTAAYAQGYEHGQRAATIANRILWLALGFIGGALLILVLRFI